MESLNGKKEFLAASSSENRGGLLEKVKAARHERAQERNKQDSATKIQALIRGWTLRRRMRRRACEELEFLVRGLGVPENLTSEPAAGFPSAVRVYEKLAPFLFFAQVDKDRQLLYSVCRYMVWSMTSKTMDGSFIAVMLNKKLCVPWIRDVKKLLALCVKCLAALDPGLTSEYRVLMTLLHTLVTFTSTSSWAFMKDEARVGALGPGLRRLCETLLGHLVQNGLFDALKAVLVKGTCCCSSSAGSPSLKRAGLLAVISLGLRPLRPSAYAENLIVLFVTRILGVPGLVHNIQLVAPEILETLEQEDVVTRTIGILGAECSFESTVDALDGNYVLGLLGNLVQLVFVEVTKSPASDLSPQINQDAADGMSRVAKEADGEAESCSGEAGKPTTISSLDHLEVVIVLTKLLDQCREKTDADKVTNKKSSTSVWHPILGWCSRPIDRQIHDALPLVWKQLNLLWSFDLIRFLFRDLFSSEHEYGKFLAESPPPTRLPVAVGDAYVREANAVDRGSSSAVLTATAAWAAIKKMMDRGPPGRKSSSGRDDAHPKIKFGGSAVTSVALCSQLYAAALRTFRENRVSILSGLCVRGELLGRMWRLLRCLGKKDSCGLHQWLDMLGADPDARYAHFDLLTLFCESSAHLLTILDDRELYEDQKPFRLDDLVNLSSFLNQFVFYSLYNGYIDPCQVSTCVPFLAVHSLLMVMYQRDSRRPFSPADHWLIKDAASSPFMYDVEKKKYAQMILRKIPHVVPHSKRVVLFRELVSQDKMDMGLVETSSSSSMPPCTLITVRRNYIVEDGYRQLIGLSPAHLKGAVRVKFVNAQGLDEAGIDQDGVFKEFLEETIKRVFDPGMNLFKTTTEGRIYPSPTSYINENYCQLFEFVGRMLAKAVYEGIVVDVPFAQFFLSQIVGAQSPAGAYSCIDELPSLDAELYRNLTYVKHYEGDVSDLDLTFTCDEDVLGQVVTHELVPGGRIVQVTNDNRILYIHKMAHFRMRAQIERQVAAFRKGFKSIINPDWLALFSTPEVQRLISGDTDTIDLKDLRKHTQYYGGFHDKHRVISWLWDVLDKDFSEQERRLFLKFVTSCSSQPLLGFGHLEPPFSIRCVEVGEDEDTGDTIGSVLRGFFTIRKKDPIGRLPTSSTCFNLLKLPNYQKKTTLKEKLRYAIHSHTGFELS